MLEDTVTISINDKIYTGWESIRINRDMEALCGGFNLNVSDIQDGKNWSLQTQLACVVKIGKDVVLTGFIDDVSGEIIADDHTVEVTGRDVTADLVDCAITTPDREYNGITFLNLAKKLIAPFKIDVIVAPQAIHGAHQKLNKFAVNAGDTVYEALDRMAREVGLLLNTTTHGKLLIVNTGAVAIADKLIFGKNIESVKFAYNFENRFSEYVVEGQKAGQGGSGWDASSINIYGKAFDQGVRRHRPTLIKQEQQATIAGAKRKAAWEAMHRAADSQTITVLVPGWRSADGSLWEVNRLIFAEIPPAYLNRQMLISHVEFSLTDEGKHTSLTLKRPDAFLPEPNKPVKSKIGIAW